MINYYSIARLTKDELLVNKSRFITYLFPIIDEDQATEALNQIRKDHPKANHHCWAYILEDNGLVQKASDDGEPSGTAGVPILEVLKQNQLTKIMAVVVRYFGGIKLGTGGLIRSYSTATSQCLQQSQIIMNVAQDIIQVIVDYSHNDSFTYYLSHNEDLIEVLDTSYSDKVSYQIALFPQDREEIKERITNLLKGQLDWQFLEQRMIDLPKKD